MKTDIAFVVDDTDGEVVAVMPGEAGTNDVGSMTCYVHMGQHSTCVIEWVNDCCRGASPDEYADLLAELTGPVDYDVKIISIDDVNSDKYTDERRKQVYNV